MTTDRDGLEEAFRENLKLRDQLAREVTKAKGVSQRSGVYHLGWVLYWACLIVAAVWAVGLLVAVINSPAGPSQILVPVIFAFIFVPALVLYGIGRAFRYVLSGE